MSNESEIAKKTEKYADFRGLWRHQGAKKGVRVNFLKFLFLLYFFLNIWKISLKSVQRFKSRYFWGPSCGQTSVFTGWPTPPKDSPHPILGWYEVSLKSLEPFLHLSNFTHFGQNFQSGPCRRDYGRTYTVSARNEISFPIISFHFVQEMIEKANFSDIEFFFIFILI